MCLRVITADVCDSAVLHCVLATIPFTDVLHLAAQAGVRYALKYDSFVSLCESGWLIDFRTFFFFFSLFVVVEKIGLRSSMFKRTSCVL